MGYRQLLSACSYKLNKVSQAFLMDVWLHLEAEGLLGHDHFNQTKKSFLAEVAEVLFLGPLTRRPPWLFRLFLDHLCCPDLIWSESWYLGFQSQYLLARTLEFLILLPLKIFQLDYGPDRKYQELPRWFETSLRLFDFADRGLFLCLESSRTFVYLSWCYS